MTPDITLTSVDGDVLINVANDELTYQISQKDLVSVNSSKSGFISIMMNGNGLLSFHADRWDVPGVSIDDKREYIREFIDALNIAGTQPISILDGNDIALGAKADTAAINNTSSWSVIALLKAIYGFLLNISNTQKDGTQKVVVNNFPATQAISAASLPLPSGAATATKQDTGNAYLASLATSGTWTALTTVSNTTPVQVGAGTSNVRLLAFEAKHQGAGGAAYIKFYDKATAPDPALDTPFAIFPIPVNAFSFNYGDFVNHLGLTTNKLWFIITKNFSFTDNTNTTNPVVIRTRYV